MKENINFQKMLLVAVIVIVYSVSLMVYTEAVPGGSSVTNLSTDTGPSTTAGNRSDAGGTINTVTLNSVQQNAGWKAYVGNVTGSLTLDDSSSQTIYDWSISTITGEVYVSRNSSISWSAITCAAQSIITAEQAVIGGADSDDDSINETYNQSQHEAMQVGVNAIGADSCRATYTFISDTRQSAGSANNFTAILLNDSSQRLVYATFIENNLVGFDGSLRDFQIVVPDADGGSITPYYFYTELN